LINLDGNNKSRRDRPRRRWVTRAIEVKLGKWIPKTLAIGLGALALTPTVYIGSAQTGPAIKMLVVHVTGAPFERGSIIDGSSELNLKEDASVTLASADGSIVSLEGPTQVVPAISVGANPSDPGLIEALGAFLRAEGNDDADPLPDPWAVSVNQPGTGCIRPTSAMLWCQNGESAERLTIVEAGGTRPAKTTWPAGRDTLSFSGSVFADGKRYVFNVGGKTADVTMHVMPQKFTTLLEQSAWMARVGCKHQALTLLELLR